MLKGSAGARGSSSSRNIERGFLNVLDRCRRQILSKQCEFSCFLHRCRPAIPARAPGYPLIQWTQAACDKLRRNRLPFVLRKTAARSALAPFGGPARLPAVALE